MSTYEILQRFVASWGLIYFGVIFVVVMIYALAPRNGKKFDHAARIPFEED